MSIKLKHRIRYVYLIEHTVTKRKYVGSTGNIELRIKSHINALRRHDHPNAEMQKDYDEYGEHYSFRILDMIPSHEFANRERQWMFRLDSFDKEYGYNFNDWGVRSLLDNVGQPSFTIEEDE